MKTIPVSTVPRLQAGREMRDRNSLFWMVGILGGREHHLGRVTLRCCGARILASAANYRFSVWNT